MVTPYECCLPPHRKAIPGVLKSSCESLCQGNHLRSPWQSSLTAHTRWRNQWRSQLIGAGHLDTARFRVRMIERQRATPRECVRFRRLSWRDGDAGRGLSPPIVDRILKLNSTADAIGLDVEESRIGHGHVRTAG